MSCMRTRNPGLSAARCARTLKRKPPWKDDLACVPGWPRESIRRVRDESLSAPPRTGRRTAPCRRLRCWPMRRCQSARSPRQVCRGRRASLTAAPACRPAMHQTSWCCRFGVMMRSPMTANWIRCLRPPSTASWRRAPRGALALPRGILICPHWMRIRWYHRKSMTPSAA